MCKVCKVGSTSWTEVAWGQEILACPSPASSCWYQIQSLWDGYCHSMQVSETNHDRTLRLHHEKYLSHRSSLYLNLMWSNSMVAIDTHVPLMPRNTCDVCSKGVCLREVKLKSIENTKSSCQIIWRTPRTTPILLPRESKSFSVEVGVSQFSPDSQ